jgi:hypothetical protein
MAKKRNKYISKAFEVLGYEEEDDVNSDYLNTFEDIDFEIKEIKSCVSIMEDNIENAKDIISRAEEQIIFLNNLKNQAEIEEFRAMNPKAKDVYKL